MVAIFNKLLKVEPVAQLGGDHSRVVLVKSADGDGVILQHAMVGYIDYVCRELEVFSQRMSRGHIERGVHGQIVSL